MLWNPSGDGSQVITVSEQHLDLWDVDTSRATSEVQYSTTFLILMTIFLDFTKELFIIGKKSCLRHLTSRPRYCLRQSGTTNSSRLTKKWYKAEKGIQQIADLFGAHENCFLLFLSLRNKYAQNCNLFFTIL